MKTLSMNLTKLTVFLAAFTFVIVLYSCQKESSQVATETAVTEEAAATYSDESTQTEASFDDVEDVSMTAAEEEVGSPTGRGIPTFDELRLRIGSCATITVSPNDSTYPKTVTIDFGSGCVCADGKFRSGAVIVFLTGPIRRPGSVMTITLRDFYLNRKHIEGTKTVSNLSENSNIKFTVEVVGGKVTFPSGRGYTYNGLKYVKQIEGGQTRIVRDDVYSIETRSKTEFNNGITVNLNTESPLIKKVACPWISDGLLKIKINSRILFLNYGAPNNGDCDDKALLTWDNGNKHRLITLP